VRTSTNPTGPEVNDHVSLQWPSYEQPQGSNLRPQRKQTSWSQALITGHHNFEAMDCGRDDLTRHFIADVWDWLHTPLLLQHGLRKELSWFTHLFTRRRLTFFDVVFTSALLSTRGVLYLQKSDPLFGIAFERERIWNYLYIKKKGDGIYIWFTIIMNKFGCLKLSCLENDCYDDKRFSLNFLSLSFKFNQWYSSSFITKIDDF
jgi:hypothetical protein